MQVELPCLVHETEIRMFQRRLLKDRYIVGFFSFCVLDVCAPACRRLPAWNCMSDMCTSITAANSACPVPATGPIVWTRGRLLTSSGLPLVWVTASCTDQIFHPPNGTGFHTRHIPISSRGPHVAACLPRSAACGLLGLAVRCLPSLVIVFVHVHVVSWCAGAH